MSIIAIDKITPFALNDGSGVAAVTISCGPVVVHAKLRKRKENGGLYLSMPCRKNSYNRFVDHCYIRDPQVRLAVEAQAITEYQRLVS